MISFGWEQEKANKAKPRTINANSEAAINVLLITDSFKKVAPYRHSRHPMSNKIVPSAPFIPRPMERDLYDFLMVQCTYKHILWEYLIPLIHAVFMINTEYL